MGNSRRVSRPWRPLVLLPVLAAALTSAACTRSAGPLVDNERERDKVVLACPGRIEGLSEAIAVNAGIDGVLEAVDVREGELVVAGQVIAKVSRAELASALWRGPPGVWRISAAMGRKKVQTGDPTEKSDRDVLEVLANLEEKEPPLVVGLRVTVQFLRRSDPPR